MLWKVGGSPAPGVPQESLAKFELKHQRNRYRNYLKLIFRICVFTLFIFQQSFSRQTTFTTFSKLHINRKY